MTPLDVLKLLLQLVTMFACALAFGTLFRRVRQPAVVGEMLGGIVLGPSLVGWVAPHAWSWLFASSASATTLRDAATRIGMLFFLFYAGLEVNLSDLKGLGRRAFLIGAIGTLLPIVEGVAFVYAVPASFWGPHAGAHLRPFALFIGMNLANSANPVIARVLMDLELLDQPIGALIMSATVVDDVVNWGLFAWVVHDMGQPAVAAAGPGGEAFLVAFLLGIVLGGVAKLRQDAVDAIGRVALLIAPIFFVSMGMSTNFITNFDGRLAVVLLAAACVTKIGSVLVGARAAGMRLDREAWAIGFGLNARGATGIILAGVGLANGVIDAPIFVALVITALVTSLMAGPAMRYFLWPRTAAAGIALQSRV